MYLRFWHHLQFIEILEELLFDYPLFKENKNMKYVTHKDQNTLSCSLLMKFSSIFFGWLRMHLLPKLEWSHQLWNPHHTRMFNHLANNLILLCTLSLRYRPTGLVITDNPPTNLSHVRRTPLHSSQKNSSYMIKNNTHTYFLLHFSTWKLLLWHDMTTRSKILSSSLLTFLATSNKTVKSISPFSLS